MSTNDDKWWECELADARDEWEAVKASGAKHTGDIFTCELCFAGDGDARCQRCGNSEGWPGCICEEGSLAGPCVEALVAWERAAVGEPTPATGEPQ